MMADEKKPKLPPRTKPRRGQTADKKNTSYVGKRRKPDPPKKS